MVNFKPLLLLPALLILGCYDDASDFFSDISFDEKKNIEYQNIHQLSLSLSKLTKTIDESGFSPVLKCQFHLENTLHGPWPQAWVAFNIGIFVGDQKVTAIKRAGVLQDHYMDIQFQQELPRFGIDIDKVKINITPIAWMPSYPLNIVTNDQKAQ